MARRPHHQTGAPSLAARCRDAFAPVIRARGQRYFEDGHVEQLELVEGAISAWVQGSGRARYEVVADAPEPDEPLVVLGCDCPYAESLDPCKHLWAVLLAIDEEGYGDRFPTADALDLLITDGEEELLLPAGGKGGGGHEIEEADPREKRVVASRPAPSPSPPRQPFESHRWSSTHSHGAWRGDPFAPSERYSYVPSKQASWSERLQGAVRDRVAGTPETGRAARRGESTPELHVLRHQPSRSVLRVRLAWRLRRQDGVWGSYARIEYRTQARVTRADATVLELLPSGFDEGHALPATALPSLLPRLCAWGGFGWVDEPDDRTRSAAPLQPLTFDGDPPFLGHLAVHRHGQGGLAVEASLRRDDDTVREEDVIAVVDGVVVTRERVVLSDRTGTDFLVAFRGGAVVPGGQVDAFFDALAAAPNLPALTIDPDVEVTVHRGVPRPRLSVDLAEPGRTLGARVTMQYREQGLGLGHLGQGVFDSEGRRLLLRDAGAEQRYGERLRELGFELVAGSDEATIPTPRFDAAVSALIDEGWDVRAAQQRLRRGGHVSLSVSSRTDWFELTGEAAFGETTAELPELLAAARAGRRWVKLGDGSFGLLPAQWLERLERIVAGEERDGVLRYGRVQGPLLDATLSGLVDGTDRDLSISLSVDAGLKKLRRELLRFDRIKPRRGPRSFRATLRHYQQQGLGWLHFLQSIGFGGCLADDMGLGKTIQVLALLDGRRKEPRASLVVAPRSLLFNWAEEAARFAPKLRVLVYHGQERHQERQRLDDHDLVLTTYGTLRLDIDELSRHSFDYVVLDEAQAIKNPRSKITRACLRIDAPHRLALTGTPIENRLEDLASILHFLNHGMVDGVPALAGLRAKRAPTEDELDLLSRALRPFILRRTKEQVLPELPDKTEQVLHCELLGKERRRYDELLRHYRTTLKERIDRRGLSRSRMHVLEALLRLRQAACHPALLDPDLAGEPSAKLSALLSQLEEVRASGHKALVFSQFTTLLGIVRRHLDRAGVTYAYLDGKTRRRAAVVERFQTDPECSTFLLSLKAGGTGLNLTAAGYVFLLDPWWNPAVEAQAIDRSHRIGQSRPVMAYRLVAKDTVEDKILELQRDKRELAEGILAAQKKSLTALDASDLDLLLG